MINAEKSLSEQTTDVMSAAFSMMQAIPKNGKCEGSSEVFDGKRRFKLVFANEGEVELKPSRYNIYAGKAVKCEVRVTPAGGKWREKPRGWMTIQEQGQQNGKLPTLWMAQLAEGQPAVPVKALLRSNFGAMVMHMTRYDNDGKALLAKKQVK